LRLARLFRQSRKTNSQKFAPRFVGCDHAYTAGKLSH
jgi:hypothetical protein